MPIPRIFIVVGVVLIVLGLLWPWLEKLGFGHLPGDIAVQRDNFSFYFPIVTSIVISLVVTILLWLFRR